MADVQDRMAGSRLAGLDDPKVPAAEEIARLLMKGIKTYAIYRHNASVVEGFLEPLNSAFGRYFKNHGALALRIEAGRFIFRGVEIYRDPPDQQGIPTRLYREGIRKLRFLEGLNSGELLKFISISAAGTMGLGASSDGIATLLWKASFEHIEYVVVEGLAPILDGDGSQADAMEAQVDGIIRYVSSRISADSGDAVRRARVLASDIDLELADPASCKSAAIAESAVSVGDAEKIQVELASEDEAMMISKVLVIILAIMRYEFGEREKEDLHENLLIIVDTLLLREDFKAIVSMITRMEDTASMQLTDGGFRDRIERLCRSLAQSLGVESRMERLGAILAAGLVKDPANFSKYLALLGNDAFKKLPDLMEKTTSPENLKLLSEALESRTALLDEAIPRLFGSGRTPVVMEGLKLAVEHDFAGREDAIGNLIRRQSPAIKAAAARALGAVHSDSSRKILADAFEAGGMDVKTAILGAIDSRDQGWAGDMLARFMAGGGLAGLAKTDQRRFIRAAAATQSQKAMEALNGILVRGAGLFNRKEAIALKLMVIDAIRVQPSLPGYMLLQRQAQRGRSEREVRSACRRAMNEIRKSLVGS